MGGLNTCKNPKIPQLKNNKHESSRSRRASFKNLGQNLGQTNRQTDRQTNRQTDRTRYRVALRLKIPPNASSNLAFISLSLKSLDCFTRVEMNQISFIQWLGRYTDTAVYNYTIQTGNVQEFRRYCPLLAKCLN